MNRLVQAMHNIWQCIRRHSLTDTVLLDRRLLETNDKLEEKSKHQDTELEHIRRASRLNVEAVDEMFRFIEDEKREMERRRKQNAR